MFARGGGRRVGLGFSRVVEVVQEMIERRDARRGTCSGTCNGAARFLCDFASVERAFEFIGRDEDFHGRASVSLASLARKPEACAT